MRLPRSGIPFAFLTPSSREASSNQGVIRNEATRKKIHVTLD
jgi:hypothetical protein